MSRKYTNSEYPPADSLRDFIDAYWVRRTEGTDRVSGRRVYADGCVDLFLVRGPFEMYYNSRAEASESIRLLKGRLYLGGTMTSYGVLTGVVPNTVAGIRFKPGGFYALYKFPMRGAVDTVVRFSDPEVQSVLRDHEVPGPLLDGLFLSKMGTLHSPILPICRMIWNSGGCMPVETLASASHLSRRTMERLFVTHLGIGPKEFSQIVRFQALLKRLRQMGEDSAGQTGLNESLLRMAYDYGYYDHAHLTREFQRYSGVSPAELSHFYKSGGRGESYF